MKYVPPSVRETAFNCPHCDALAKQDWYYLLATEHSSDDPLPFTITAESREKMKFDRIENDEERNKYIQWADTMVTGRPFFEFNSTSVYAPRLNNVFLSRCFNCDDVSIWIFNKLVYPRHGKAPPVNPDLSEDVKQDYNEASSILDLSPRGAAALIRLAIQKLCKELGQTGHNINSDIGALVAAGLDARIQKALDVVRVVGNNAVHPGQIDLRDDRTTAENLFQLLNLIAEKMISQPKHVDELYSKLPPESLTAIQNRD